MEQETASNIKEWLSSFQSQKTSIFNASKTDNDLITGKKSSFSKNSSISFGIKFENEFGEKPDNILNNEDSTTKSNEVSLKNLSKKRCFALQKKPNIIINANPEILNDSKKPKLSVFQKVNIVKENLFARSLTMPFKSLPVPSKLSLKVGISEFNENPNKNIEIENIPDHMKILSGISEEEFDKDTDLGESHPKDTQAEEMSDTKAKIKDNVTVLYPQGTRRPNEAGWVNIIQKE